jgi:hypothetical protein
MPYKSLSAPRQCLDAAAEIRAAAVLGSPALVAMVTSDPARLALVPAAGGSGKVAATQLGSAEAVALLSKDVAVVKSADDVWALLDITHTPKPEQVARDARSLHARSSGDSALVLGWDGSATLLTVGKNEVAARQLALRGEVRAAYLDSTETMVVVSGHGGGELRFHPGPTPEAGATARCPLPAAAAPLDQLRGGRDLCVLFTAGRREVCVVRRIGPQLSAKMLELEVSPADVAVSESSMFAVFADGRAALYDGATLAGADGAVEPTAALALGARGEPRAVVVTGRGSPTLWIGSGVGEVISVSVVRKTA